MSEHTSKKVLIEAIVNHQHFCFVGQVDKFMMKLWLHWQHR